MKHAKFPVPCMNVSATQLGAQSGNLNTDVAKSSGKSPREYHWVSGPTPASNQPGNLKTNHFPPLGLINEIRDQLNLNATCQR